MVISFARRTFTTSPGCRRTIRSPSKATISFSDSMRTSIWLVSGRITGRLFVAWAQIGVMMMTLVSGAAIGPPADRL